MELVKIITFYFIIFATVCGAVCTIFANNIKNLLACSSITFLSVGLLFFYLKLPFLAFIQIIFCAIGITAAVIFAVKVAKQEETNIEVLPILPRFFPAAAGIILFSSLILLFLKYSIISQDDFNLNFVLPKIKYVVVSIFINYGITFFISGLVFLAAFLGYRIILAKQIKGKK